LSGAPAGMAGADDKNRRRQAHCRNTKGNGEIISCLMEKIDFPWVKPALDRLPSGILAMPHALMLSGQAGLGKKTVALYLAKALLCETEREGQGACGHCASCHLYRAENHPDLRIIEAGQETGPASESPDDEPVVTTKKPSRQISV